ncbi:MAG: hypothetical protein Q7S92_02360 [Candidatus Diapherotrites archaeon]|nr:hypothetical protein [Candidatus Diapherotrites archaeon]
MKKIVWILVLFFSLTVIAQQQEQCQIAAPIFGVVKCDSANTEQMDDKSYEFINGATISSIDIPCVSECQIDSKASITDPQGRSLNNSDNDFCEGPGWRLELKIVDIKYPSNILWSFAWGSGETGANLFPFVFTFGKTIRVTGQCIGFTVNKPIRAGSKIEVAVRKIYLYEHPDNFTDFSQIPNTIGCIPNDFAQKYSQQKIVSGNLPNSYYENATSVKSVDPTYKSVDEISQSLTDPLNLHAGETYAFLSGWKIIPDIGVIYNKDNLPNGYCGGGAPGSRQLFSFSKITSASGACYMIPTTVQRTVECCYSEDCKFKDPTGALLCDPNTFSCTDKKPCNSDLECQVPGQATCFNKSQTDWRCDLTQKTWPNFNGVCVKSIKPVLCCSDSECSSDEYCNKEEGCKSRYIRQECPYGSCCSAGGTYVQKDCDQGQQCCKPEGSFVGACKDSCELKKETVSSNIASLPNLPQNANPLGSESQGNLVFPILLIFAVVGIIGAGAYFFYLKPQNVPVKISESKSIACSNCKSAQRLAAVFCTNCGQKMN